MTEHADALVLDRVLEAPRSAVWRCWVEPDLLKRWFCPAPFSQSRMPGGDDLVMNMSLTLGTTTIMASDAPDGMYSAPRGFAVSISPPSLAEFDRIFEALGSDARAVMMPPGETFWAERFAMFTDRFGTPWMLSHAGGKAG